MASSSISTLLIWLVSLFSWHQFFLCLKTSLTLLTIKEKKLKFKNCKNLQKPWKLVFYQIYHTYLQSSLAEFILEWNFQYLYLLIISRHLPTLASFWRQMLLVMINMVLIFIVLRALIPLLQTSLWDFNPIKA